LNKSNLYYHNWIIQNGIKYTIDDVVIHKKVNEQPIFAQIKLIISDHQSFIHFQLNQFQTLNYLPNYSGYEVKEIEMIDKFSSIENLISPWPLDKYILFNKNLLIIPKYEF
jgi:hypothetical protein